MISINDLPLISDESVINKIQNSQAITVWVSNEYFFIEPNYKKSLIPTILKVHRKEQKISQIKQEEMNIEAHAVPHYFSFFIGVMSLNGKNILLVTEEVQLICSIQNRDIFKITKPQFLFFNPKDKDEITENEETILKNIVIIFQQGMYFSYSYDLTQPLHFTHERKLSKSRFNWAQKFQSKLACFDKMWSIPIIQGFIGKMQLYINAKKIKIILISRRSREASGTQDSSTGINEQGCVSNYVQTQQILCIQSYLFSFMQVRGSVPLFWRQQFSYGMISDLKVQKTAEENARAFDKHLNLVKNRGDFEGVILLNLLCQKNLEEKLIKKYEFLVKKKKRQDFIYVYYDLHARSENKNYATFHKFIRKALKRVIQFCSFTAIGGQKFSKKYEILHTQKGIIRTNCLHCIDRTNIAQNKIAAFHILQVFKHLDLKNDNFREDLEFLEGDNSFANLYRNLWADNGDYLSKQYVCTSSTESQTIRNGKLSYLTSLDHGMTSIERALRNISNENEEKNMTLKYIAQEEKMKNHNMKIKTNFDCF